MKQVSLLSFLVFLFFLGVRFVSQGNDKKLAEHVIEDERIDFKKDKLKIKKQLRKLHDYTEKSSEIQRIQLVQEEELHPLRDKLLQYFYNDENNLDEIEKIQKEISIIKRKDSLPLALLEKLSPRLSWLLYLEYNISFDELADLYNFSEIDTVNKSIDELENKSFTETTMQRILLFKGIIDEDEYERKIVLDKSLQNLAEQNEDEEFQNMRKLASNEDSLVIDQDSHLDEREYEKQLREINYNDEELEEMQSGLEESLSNEY